MTAFSTTHDLFFTRCGMESSRVQGVVSGALTGMDDGELFLEYCQSENLTFDDGRLKDASFNTSQGFGLRSVLGEQVGYAHASELSEEAIARAAKVVRGIHSGQDAQAAVDRFPFGTNRAFYSDVNPLQEMAFDRKVALLQEIDRYLRDKDPRVRQVTASLAGEWQAVHIMKADGREVSDIRPLVRLNISVVMEHHGRMERGSSGAGGRTAYADWLTPERWRRQADTALRQAQVNLESVAAPAGEMEVVLGPGWPGVLLHEAVGHGLEGDFNRKGTSAFAGLIGEQVAAPGVTVVDDGMMQDRRGSLSIDDEGTPSGRAVLIEDGILKGYMQDRQNARLMGVAATGNGRRESYACQPMPRMTNTYMLAGDQTQEELISQVKKGLFAVHFGGGQVDITSGKFVFSASEAYLIENGRIGRPVKGATLIGNGPDVLTKVRGIANDFALDEGVGTCGKAGQSVPVGVGQPSMLIGGLTVGGTEAG